MKCAECLAADPENADDAVTVMSGMALCDTHRLMMLAAFEEAQVAARVEAFKQGLIR